MTSSNDQYDDVSPQEDERENADFDAAELEMNESDFNDAFGITSTESSVPGEQPASLEEDEQDVPSFDFEAFLDNAVEGAEADRSMRELWASLSNQDSALLDKPVGAELDDEGEDWGMVGWGIEVARDEEGKTLKGKEARDDPANLVIYGPDGDTIASVLLTPTVQAQMQQALIKVGKMYEDPAKPKEAVGETLEKIVTWHKEHKIMGAVSALFITAFVVLTVIGFFVMT